ncbi:hypothetical protein PoB_002846200 [Plakobranchus ocellatus]|uniref:Uncharacterized protein n=1 Tax=Plakobranchus ocellatus TaxID=259542 RepID=A0AAV4A3R7_9GAST|nr:hypothetical protein PoB_002846200 [Plakobranchus ocellatus]
MREHAYHTSQTTLADTASPQQRDLRLSGPPSGRGAGDGARIRDRRVPGDLRTDSLATVPPTPRTEKIKRFNNRDSVDWDNKRISSQGGKENRNKVMSSGRTYLEKVKEVPFQSKSLSDSAHWGQQFGLPTVQQPTCLVSHDMSRRF